MSSLLRRISVLFTSKEKVFENHLIEELENKNFLNLMRIQSKLSPEQRYKVTNKLLSSRKISGIVLTKKNLYFFSMEDEALGDLKNRLKNTGLVNLDPLKKHWKIKDKILDLFLQHLERGVMSEEAYYSLKYLQNYILSTLQNKEEYEIQEISRKLKIELDLLLSLIHQMVDDAILGGVVKDQQLFLSRENFEIMLTEYVEEKSEELDEINFDSISKDLGVSIKTTESFLVSMVEKNPGKYVVYPLENKIVFKR